MIGYNYGYPQMPGNNLAQKLQQFEQFKSTFRGDPQQMVQQLRDSGLMSQKQFEQLAQMANQLYPQIKR